MDLTDKDKERILAALRTQYVGLRAGNVFEEEAGGSATTIEKLYLKLGGKPEDMPECH